MKILIYTLLCCGTFVITNAQTHLQAENAFGGRDVDNAFSIQQTRDGGFITVGRTQSNNGNVHGNHGEFDYWVVKLGKFGGIQWQRCFGGELDETAFSVQQTTDGGYIIAGQSNSNFGQVKDNHGVLDFWIVKLDTMGNMVWSKSLGGSKDDFAHCIQQTKDGGYIVVGGSNSNDDDITNHHGLTITTDYWLVKLDATGNKQWQRSYGGTNNDFAQSVIQTTDGGYIIAGNTNSKNGDVTNVRDTIYGDAWIVKTDAVGNIQWQKTYGGSDYDQMNSIQQTKEGGYVACGWTRSNDGDVTGAHGNYDFWIIKLDSAGTLKWQRPLGGSEGDLAYSIEQTSDGGYIAAGGTGSNNGQVTGFHGREDFWVVRLTQNGNIKWEQALGSTELEEAKSVDITKDGGYIVAGWTGFENNNNGDVTGTHGNYDVWITKLTETSHGITSQNLLPVHNVQLQLSPNPAHNFIQLNVSSNKTSALLRITNSNGNVVIQQNISINKKLITQLNISKLQPGIYTVSIIAGKDVASKQFIKE